jgi:hypothetical protein
MIFFHILWWVACIPIALGLLLALWFMLVSVYAFIISGPADDDAEIEAGGLNIFIVLVLLLIVPAACVLLLFWILGMAPDDFSFLGSPIYPMPLPDYHNVGWAVRWITIAILCAGPIWATLATLAALRKRIAKRSESKLPK